jgi:hypothetical protein
VPATWLSLRIGEKYRTCSIFSRILRGSHQGALRIIAAITQAEVIRKILRHLKLAADPPPLAPARARQATFDWVA